MARRLHAIRCVALSVVLAAPAQAAGPLEFCQAVTHRMWSAARQKLREQTPLAELAAAKPAGFEPGETGSFAKPGQSVADALAQDHAAPDQLVKALRDQPPQRVMRFGDSTLWLFDRVEGTLGCHTTLAVAVPPDAPAHEVALPGAPDPSELCALSALTTVTIDGTPTLWIEQSGAFSNALSQSTVTIGAVSGDTFLPPCTLVIDYTINDRATHAFCDGIDCVPLIRMAELLAMRLRNDETADALGAGVVPAPGSEETAYRRMADLAAAEAQPVALPTFGVPLDTPYTTFTQPLIFPVRADNGALYLARLGHGGFGWRQSPDTLLALYRLQDDYLVPAAAVYVAARRDGIAGIAVK